MNYKTVLRAIGIIALYGVVSAGAGILAGLFVAGGAYHFMKKKTPTEG